MFNFLKRLFGNTTESGSIRKPTKLSNGPNWNEERKLPLIKITDSAKSQIANSISSVPGSHLRLRLIPDGSNAFRYEMEIGNVIQDNDFIDNSNGFILLVDSQSARLVRGTTVDWIKRDNGTSGFYFDNPNGKPGH